MDDLNRLRDRLRVAVLQVCPDAENLLGTKAGLKPSLNPEAGPDYQLNLARAAFKRMKGQQRQQASEAAASPPPDEGVTITTVSDLGTERMRRYTTCEALAEGLVEAISEAEADQQDKAVADVRLLGGGVIGICTATHLARQTARGMLYCGDCGDFFIGDRGLRQHQMIKHGLDFAGAVGVVETNRQQLVAFTADGVQQQAWVTEREEQLVTGRGCGVLISSFCNCARAVCPSFRFTIPHLLFHECAV